MIIHETEKIVVRPYITDCIRGKTLDRNYYVSKIRDSAYTILLRTKEIRIAVIIEIRVVVVITKKGNNRRA